MEHPFETYISQQNAATNQQIAPDQSNQFYPHSPTEPNLIAYRDASGPVAPHPTRRPSEPFIHQPNNFQTQIHPPSFQPAIEETVSVHPYAGHDQNVHLPLRQQPQVNNDRHHPERVTESDYQFMRAFRSLYGYIRGHSHRQQQQQQQQQHRRSRDRNHSTDTQRALMSSPSTSTADSVPQKKPARCHCCSRYLLPLLLLVFSLGGLGISSFLLYQYFQPWNCTSTLETDSMTHGGTAEKLTQISNKSVSAHVQLTRGGYGKPLKIKNPEASRNTFRHMASSGRALEVPLKGSYYVYFSVLCAYSNRSEDRLSISLSYSRGHGNRVLLTAVHTWCKVCDQDLTTLYNGGVFDLDVDGDIYVNVTEGSEKKHFTSEQLSRDVSHCQASFEWSAVKNKQTNKQQQTTTTSKKNSKTGTKPRNMI